MQLTDSFLLTTDEDLLLGFSGTFNTEHASDLSDNPQDKLLYIGSLATARTLKDAVNPGIDSIMLSIEDALPVWVAATAYTVGQYRQPTSPNTYRYKVSVAGTSHASTEPTWPTTPIGATVVDNGVTWELVGKKHDVSEYKLATSSIGLDSAIGGAPLDLGVTIDSLAANAVPIYIRIENAVVTPGDDTVDPDVTLNFATGIKEF